MNTLSSANKSTLWAYAQSWLGRGITLVVFFALARLLSPAEFGEFAVTMVFLTLGEIFVEQLFAHPLIQRSELRPQHLNAAFWATLCCGALLATITVVGAPLFAQQFDSPKSMVPLIRGISPVFIFMAISSVPAALLRRSLDYRTLAQRTALSNLVSGAVAIASAWAGWGVWAFVAQVLSFQIVGAAILWRHETWRPQWQFSKTALLDLSGFSASITIVRLLHLGETRLVELMIAKFLGMTAVGNYALAARAQQAAMQLLAAPLWDASSVLFSREQADRSFLNRVLLERSQMAATLIVPAFLLAAASAQALLPAVFGPKWSEAVVPFQILCMLCAVCAVTSLYGAFLQGVGDGKASVWLATLRCVLSLGLIPALLHYGVAGVATSLLLGQILPLPYAFYVIGKKTGLGVRQMLQPIVQPWLVSLASAALALSVVQLQIPMAALWVALLSLGTGTLAFLLLMALLAPHILQPYLQRLPGKLGKFLSAALQRRSPGSCV